MSQNLTREQAIAEHRKMWRWIANETLQRKEVVGKSEYFSSLEDMPQNLCFACEYSIEKCNNLSSNHCIYCPFDWGSEVGIFFCDDRYEYDDNKGLFGLWCKYHKEGDWKEAAKYAREIAELPERKVE